MRCLRLVEATRLDKDSGVQVSPNVANGTEFAPMPFLNREPEHQGAKRRVRSIEGLAVKI